VRRNVLWALAGLAAAIGVIAVLTSASRGPNLEGGTYSGPLPRLSGPTLTGGTVSPADYRGKVVVVNFWAAWCGPCRVEQPILQDAWEERRDDGVFFLGIDYNDDPAAARAHVREFGVTYPSLEDPDKRITGVEFGVAGIPATIVADRRGQMRYLFVGAVSEAELTAALDELTAE
jgi:thiol-disulfide isomerase/thioredoxin